MTDVKEVEVVLTSNDRVTLRVGDVFLKVDADQARIDAEVEAMALAPVPTPEILWRKRPVLALAALAGRSLGSEESSAEAWAAAGAVVSTLHDAPLPSRTGRSIESFVAQLDVDCEWLVANDVLPADVVEGNRRLAESVLRPWTPVFVHGDLHVAHVFVDGDEVTGIIDWSEGAQGDALFDLATLTLAHRHHLDDVLRGYGRDVDRDLIRGWWSMRCLLAVRWLIENDYGPPEDYPEVDLLRTNL
jgi:aminoglycoside phosphotransferase (APT) family kinase protein